MIFVEDRGTVNRVPGSARTLVRDMDATTGWWIVALVWQDFFSGVGERNRGEQGTREEERSPSGWPASNSVFIPRTSPGPS